MDKLRDQYQQKVLILALFAGEIMLKSGAEIYRVEDTIARICRTCGIDYVECMATTTGLFLSLDSKGDENNMHTFIKRIGGSSINLSKISRINQFSRELKASVPEIAKGQELLREINAEKLFPFPLRILAAVFVGAFIVPYFGGDVFDMISGAIGSGLGYLISTGINKLRFPGFMNVFISCAGCTLMVLLLARAGLGHNVTPVFIGAVTLFMPGVAITNATRDLLSGEMLAGVSRFAEALIFAVAITGGIGLMLQIWLSAGGEYYYRGVSSYPLPLFVLFGALITLGLCVLFQSPKRMMAFSSIIGGLGMLILVGGTYLGYSPVVSTFAGTCLVAVLAEIASRVAKDATTIFILPGIIPFVPGTKIYRTMENILDGDYALAAATGSEALIIAGSIAFALIFIATATRLVMALIRRITVLINRRSDK